MKDDLNTDPELDRLLASLPRFDLSRDFEDRVMERVRIPLPAWAVAIRDGFRGMVTGPRGWVTLGTFSAATAVTWFLAIGAMVSQPQLLGAVVAAFASELLLPAWSWLMADVAANAGAFWFAMTGWLAAAGLSVTAFAVLYSMVAGISLIGLRRATMAPARTGMRSHAAH